MSDLLSTLCGLISSLGNVQTVNVIKERILLIETELNLVKKRFIDLEKENASLTEDKAELEKKLSTFIIPDQYIEYRGALFKRKGASGYADQPICPDCHSVMISFQNIMSFECGNKSCKKEANFNGRDINKIMLELQEKHQK